MVTVPKKLKCIKKTATTLCLILSVIFGYSQNIVLMDDNHNVISNTTVYIFVDSTTNTVNEILVKNAGSIADTIKVVRTIYSVDPLDQTQCSVLPAISVNVKSEAIEPSASCAALLVAKNVSNTAVIELNFFSFFYCFFRGIIYCFLKILIFKNEYIIFCFYFLSNLI